MRSEKLRTQYFVMLHEERWMVQRDGRIYGPYQSREAAITHAIDTAYASGKNDRPSQVLTQGGDGEFNPEWTFGEDMYPPTGERPLSPW